MSALRPASWKRCFRRFALSGSLNVAIVTIGSFCLVAASLSKHQPLAECKIRRREPMVEDEINEHAGDRNIKPDRHCPAPKPAMAIPSAPEHWHQRNDHQRQRDKREQHVGDEKREINPRDQSGIAGRFFAHVHVIDDVTDKKTGGCSEGDDHARHMTPPEVAPNPEPARRNENGADGVERRIDRWEIRYCHCHRFTQIKRRSKSAKTAYLKISVNLC